MSKKNGKFLQEHGRLRYTEKSFEVVMGNGEPNPDCPHGWYRTAKYGAVQKEQCVLCGTPRADCEAQLARRATSALDSPTTPTDSTDA